MIDENGENLGVMFTREAFEQAQEVGLDLVEISPNSDPPVAKFLDIGRYKYEAQKKANEQRKKQKTQEIKEIKMRPNIDDHDYDTKMKKVFEFLEEGDKVKVTMRFRGREMAHGQLGMAVLQRVSEQTADALSEAVRRIPVVVASRTGSGTTLTQTYGFPGSESDLLRRGAVLAGWLDPRKSRLLLWSLLALGHDRDLIAREFTARGRP